jgi:hypothetical protein
VHLLEPDLVYHPEEAVEVVHHYLVAVGVEPMLS